MIDATVWRYKAEGVKLAHARFADLKEQARLVGVELDQAEKDLRAQVEDLRDFEIAALRLLLNEQTFLPSGATVVMGVDTAAD